MLNVLTVLLVVSILFMLSLFEYKTYLQCLVLKTQLPKRKKVKKVVISDDLD